VTAPVDFGVLLGRDVEHAQVDVDVEPGEVGRGGGPAASRRSTRSSSKMREAAGNTASLRCRERMVCPGRTTTSLTSSGRASGLRAA
jgi:hypothetical protein